MSTNILARPLKAFASAAGDLPWFGTRRRSPFAIFRSQEISERFAHLINQYQTLPLDVRANPAHQETVKLVEYAREQTRVRPPSHYDVDAVERALLSMLPGEDLKREAGWLREKFGETAGDERTLKAYARSKPPEVDACSETTLRADLLALQANLQDIRKNRRDQIRARNRITCLTVFLSAIAIFITLQLDELLHMSETIVFDVFGVGMLGGVFSTLIRIQKFKLGGPCEATALSQPGNQATVILSPAIGGFCAVVLFAILAAGLLKGSLFPELPAIELGTTADALESLFKVHLSSSTEAAKLYVLCFLAGFAERLVPDVLTRLAAAAKEEK